tara:strand:+ start:9750 stop:9857 length:108 start_codon:yes stop_codon:yes gene_type:complete
VTESGYFILGFIVVFFGGLYILGYKELFDIWDKED